MMGTYNSDNEDFDDDLLKDTDLPVVDENIESSNDIAPRQEAVPVPASRHNYSSRRRLEEYLDNKNLQQIISDVFYEY